MTALRCSQQLPCPRIRHIQAYSLIIHNVDNPLLLLCPTAQMSPPGPKLGPHGAFTSKGMASMFQCLNWDPPAFPHLCSHPGQDWVIQGTQHGQRALENQVASLVLGPQASLGVCFGTDPDPVVSIPRS